jgi:hypothetical protein
LTVSGLSDIVFWYVKNTLLVQKRRVTALTQRRKLLRLIPIFDPAAVSGRKELRQDSGFVDSGTDCAAVFFCLKLWRVQQSETITTIYSLMNRFATEKFE